MASDLFRTLPLFAMAAVLGLSTAATALRAATGDILLEYKSSLFLTPENQGWTHEGRTIGPGGMEPGGRCPGDFCVGGTGIYCACWFMGAQDLNNDQSPDNNCLPSIGCRKTKEHYNSPDPQAGYQERITYTEWIAFDNGNNAGPRPLIIPDSTITHSPPWGAPSFLNAPAYPTMRVSTGDGNNTANTLPANFGNNRNLGKVKIRRTFTPGTASAFTLVVKAAAGPRDPARHFVEIRAFGRRFGFGVDGKLGSPTYGKLTLVDPATQPDETHFGLVGTLFDHTVMVAQPGVQGPHTGEFFTLRVVVNQDGTFTAWLNENGDLVATGSMATSTFTPPEEIQLTPGVGDDTMWFDSVQLLVGAMPVPCPKPLGDMNADGQVDINDMESFMDCVSGPGLPPSGLFGDTFQCRCLDRDGDADVDMVDFAAFQRCLTIGGVIGPGCDD